MRFAALGKAMTLLQRVGMDVLEEVERSLTRRTLQGLSRIPGITVFGVPDPDAPRFHRRGGTIVFSAKRVPHNLAAKELGEKGVLKFEISQLERDASRKFALLGNSVYQTLAIKGQSSVTKNSADVKSLIAEIGELEKRIQEKEKALKEIG